MTPETEEIIEHIDSEEEDQDAGAPIYRIRSYPSDPELETLYARWKREDIVIPSFQRGFVWKPSQASRLIESFLMGLPVPGIFVLVEGQDGKQKQLVIDGQQRLRSVFSYFDGFFPNGRAFRLSGVDERWEGKRYADLSSAEQNALLTSVLRVVNIEQRGPDDDEDDSVCQIFERLNTGGIILTPQEIRNSSYRGPFNNMLIRLNKNPLWRSIFGTPSPDLRMRDIELIVRFLALSECAEYYSKPMKRFLNVYMKTHQKELALEEYENTFLTSVQLVIDNIGERPFHIRRGINVAVFDSVMVAFAKDGPLPDDIGERYQILKRHQRFIELTTASTTDVNIVRERLELAESLLLQ